MLRDAQDVRSDHPWSLFEVVMSIAVQKTEEEFEQEKEGDQGAMQEGTT